MDTSGVSDESVIIGFGEVGQALQAILKCPVHDPQAGVSAEGKTCRFLHIAIPYSEKFLQIVSDYQKQFKADLIVIHSTVPIGTTDKLKAVHSPIRGVHPKLRESIETFVKFFGGQRAREAAVPFVREGYKIRLCMHAKDTEAMKLWDTTQYGLNIMIQKEIKRFCDDEGLDYSIVYSEANQTYNEGYQAMGLPQFQKYVLKDKWGKIGGHCVVPNAELLKTRLARWLVRYNARL